MPDVLPPRRAPVDAAAGVARIPVHDPSYGWVLVGAAVVSLAFQSAFVNAGSVLIVGITTEDGWSRTAVTAAVSSVLVGGGIWAPVVGLAIGRWGARRVLPFGAGLSALSLIVASFAPDAVTLGAVLVLLAAPGLMGVGSLANMAVIQSWFTRRRGTALSLADSGASVGMMVMVPSIQLAVDAYGWRATLQLLGAAGLLLIPLHGLLQRRPPDRPTVPCTSAGPQQQSADAPGPTASVTGLLRQIRTPRFGLLAGGLTSIWVAQQVVTTHQAAYLAEHGYDAAAIAGVFALAGFAGLIGRPVFGWLIDQIGPTATAGLVAACLSAAIVSLMLTGDGQLGAALTMYALTLGASLGVGTLLFARLVAELFGQRSFGGVMGLAYLIGTSTAAVAATLAGLSRDLTGTYVPAFGVAMVATLLGSGSVWLLERRRRA